MSELMQAVSRWAIVATLGGLGAACSADSMRFSETPFANPFATDAGLTEPRTTGSVEPARAAPVRTAAVRAEPLQPVGGSNPSAPAERYASTGASGWTAEGGTPITVSAGDTLAAISNRYGVPAPAILSANGITASQVTPGRRVVIPVYSASGARPARAATPASSTAPRPVAAGNPASEGRVVATTKIAVVKPAPKTIADAAAPRVRPGQVLAKPAPAANVAARLAEVRKTAAAEPKIVGSIEPKHPRPGRSAATAKVEAPAKADAPQKVAAGSKPVAPKAEPRPVAKVVRTEPLPAKPEPKVAKAEPAKPEPKVAKAEPAKPAKSEPAKVAEASKSATKTPEPAKVAAAAPAPAKEVETTASVQPAAPTAEFRWPARGRVISGFGGGGSNEGVNIALPEGTPVKAAESGTVAYAGSEVKGYGNLVLIRHDNGYVSAYAHNGDIDVKRGQKVTRGQTIAKSGQTGNVTSPQLHFEIRKGSTPVDPIRYLASN